MCIPYDGRVSVPLAWQHDRIGIRLPDDACCLASVKLQWAVDVVRELAVTPSRTFKVGITANPPQRLDFYAEAWGRMTIIGISSVREEVSQIEASLIMTFGHVHGCQNIGKGGEGANKMSGPMFFNYVVVR
jgi:hypothetical protein